MSGGKKFSFSRWIDEWKLSFLGVRNVLPRRRFWLPAIITFIIFGTLLSLLSAGTNGFNLLFSPIDFSMKMKVIGDAFLKLFGVNQTTVLDWAFTFFVALLQGILLGLVFFVFKARKDSASLQNAGIVAGLAILGSGCPTCGTTLLMPIVVSIAGSSSMALASTISWLLTVASLVIAFLALKKVGFEAFAIIEDEKFRAKHDKIKSKKESHGKKVKQTKDRQSKDKQTKDGK